MWLNVLAVNQITTSQFVNSTSPIKKVFTLFLCFVELYRLYFSRK